MAADREDTAGIPLTELATDTLGTTALSVAHFNGALQHARQARELEEQFEREGGLQTNPGDAAGLRRGVPHGGLRVPGGAHERVLHPERAAALEGGPVETGAPP